MFDISIFYIYRILHYTKKIGISSETLLKKAGVDLLKLNRFDSKVSEKYYYATLEEAVRLTQDPFLGLHLGEFTELRDLSNLGYIMANCQDLGEALESAGDYLDFIGAPVDLNLFQSAEQCKVVVKTKQSSRFNIRQCIDDTVSSLFILTKSVAKKQFKLKEVRFSYPAPEDTREYKKIFNCPVLFGQQMSALVFHSRDLLIPVIQFNSKLLFLSKHSKNYIRDIIDEKEYSRKITILLFAQLQKGPPCIKHVAKELGVSTRCLQMKLSNEGVTFSQVVRDFRKELAKTYLGDKDYSIDDITFLLGFSEPSVFHRAFKNWTGQTPGEYRNIAWSVCKSVSA